MSLFHELKRRNVFRVGAAYLALSWVTLQAVNLVVPIIEAPDWVEKVMLIFMVAGFPIALFFAWAFELTPDGVKKTAEVDMDESITSTTGQKINYIVIGSLLIAVLLLLYDRNNHDGHEVATFDALAGSQSIAVLPFADMSADGTQEYFSDGISEEILNVLVKIPELKVAGRTSSFAYKGENKDLRVIGSELNVDHILEGSVRKSGTKLRITAQLIRSSDGFHLWSETYDREMTDIFEIQDDISKSIADALAISLGIDQGETLVKYRTGVPAAYEAYLKARAAYAKRNEGLNEAILHLSEVLIYDPEFVPAWALMAKTYSILPYYVGETGGNISGLNNDEMWDHYLPLAQRTVDLALNLDPNYPETLVAQANIYKEQYDYAMADRTYKRAIALNPRDADAHQQYTEVLIILGHSERAVEHALTANALDPNVPILMNVAAWAYLSDDQPDKALNMTSGAIAIDPTLISPFNNTRGAYVRLKNIDGIIETFEKRPGLTPAERQALVSDWKRIKENTTLSENPKFWSLLTVAPREIWIDDIENADVVELLIENQQSNRYGQFQFVNRLTKEEWQDPRVRQLLDYQNIIEGWQEAGFPKGCKPVGDDGFDCSERE